MKSKLTKQSAIDWDTEIVITELFADKKIIDWYYQQFKNILNAQATDQEIWQRINAIVVRENIFNSAMSRIVKSFTFDYDETEIKETAQQLQKQNPHQEAMAFGQSFELYAKKVITKMLIFEYLQKELNIVVSDEEIKKSLQGFYRETNQSVRDYLDDKEKFEQIRRTMLEEKTIAAIIDKIKYKIDLKTTDYQTKIDEKK